MNNLPEIQDRILYTPGEQNPPEKEVVTFKQDIADQYDALEARRREINLQLSENGAEINRILESTGQIVAENGAWQKSISRVGKLRLDAEGLEAGLRYVEGQMGLLKRVNSWLKTR